MFHFPCLASSTPSEPIAVGHVLRARGARVLEVLYLEHGSVLLGLCEDGQLRHQLGVVEGPAWLDAAYALVDQPCAVDMLAQARVRVRRVPVRAFRHSCAAWPTMAVALLKDMAKAYVQQTELAVSRVAQDAETRCVQWLLRQAQRNECGVLCITLQQRKRSIAAQLGIAPETLSRVLRHLRDQGLIAGTGRTLSLPQPQALQQWAKA